MPLSRSGLTRGLSFQVKTGLAFGALALVVFTAVGAVSGSRVRDEITHHSGATLQHMASRLAEAIDAGMFERFREIRNLAALQSLIGSRVDPQDWRTLAEQLQTTLPYYSWIGVTDTEGRVVAATGGILQGRDVSARPWFSQGLRGTYVGDVHDAVLLASLLPRTSEQEPLRLVDFAAPVQLNGRTSGVLGAHLDMRWAESLRRAALSTTDVNGQVDVLVLSRSGAVLLGPAAPRLPEAQGESLARLAQTAPVMRSWSDGAHYLTAAVATRGQSDFPGLGWVVVVRQSAETALQPAVALQTRVWFYGLAGALLFGVAGWWLAGWLTSPLRAVALQARRLVPVRTSGEVDAPEHKPLRLYRLNEVAELASSLSTLVQQLREREQALLELTAGLEARVQERTASLDQANADLRSFGRSVSHDIRGPIASMAQMLSLVLGSERHPLAEDTRQALTVLRHECDRMIQLLDELMLLSKVEDQPLQRVQVCMQTLVDAVLADLNDGRTQVNIQGPLPVVTGDPVLLRQVWQNLLSNAFKFSAHSHPPQVTIVGKRNEAELVFSVSDNGAGFDMTHAGDLFSAFRRLPGASAYQGSGVGLSIVQRILHRHDGRIAFNSRPGEGATFTFTLPAA